MRDVEGPLQGDNRFFVTKASDSEKQTIDDDELRNAAHHCTRPQRALTRMREQHFRSHLVKRRVLCARDRDGERAVLLGYAKIFDGFRRRSRMGKTHGDRSATIQGCG